jgi:hypothetical protein
MRFYNQQHRFYGGALLHARTMYLCVLDDADAVVESMRLVVETTAKPNVAGAVSAKEVNSDPPAMR